MAREYGEYYFPFSELMNGDRFVLGKESPIYEKTSRNTYRNIENEEVFRFEEDKIHWTKVALAPSCYLFS